MTYKNGIKEYALTGVMFGVPMGILFGLMHLSLLLGVITGFLCGFLFAFLIFLFVKYQEKKFDKKRTEIAKERKIICDGGATINGNGGWMFFTENGIEFYPHKINISTKEILTLNVLGDYPNNEASIIIKLANLDSINVVSEKDATAASFMVGITEFNVPLANNIDIAAELEKLNKDLEYQLGFLASVQKKLSNERFVNNAPATVVEGERKKLADAESKIATIKETISALSK